MESRRHKKCFRRFKALHRTSDERTEIQSFRLVGDQAINLACKYMRDQRWEEPYMRKYFAHVRSAAFVGILAAFRARAHLSGATARSSSPDLID